MGKIFPTIKKSEKDKGVLDAACFYDRMERSGKTIEKIYCIKKMVVGVKATGMHVASPLRAA